METAAAYIRVSTDKQDELSPDAQLRLLKEYAQGHDLLLPEEYIFWEIGVSGRKAERRPEFLRMISLAKSHPSPFQYILVWKFSRFAAIRKNPSSTNPCCKRIRRSGHQCVRAISRRSFRQSDRTDHRMMDEYYSIRYPARFCAE